MTKINKGLPLLAGLVSFALISSAYAYSPITAQLNPGARGGNVINLQTFFRDNSDIYPSGLVTGYYGGLTKSAVLRFQAAYGLGQVGRVGPQTLLKINGLINSGGWSGNPTTSDDSAPMIYSVGQSIGSNYATFNWTTNEYAKAKVFYSLSPVTINEGDINSFGFALVSGSVASNDDQLRSTSQITINNLMPNTMYYYMIVSTDATGNVSVSNVNNTFRTTN